MWENRLTKYTGLRPAQAVMLFIDAIAIQVVLLIVVLLRSLGGDVDLELYVSMGVILCCAPIFSLLFGAGQMPLPPAHREVKHIFLMVSLSYLVVLFYFFINQISVDYSRLILIFSWLGSVFAVPVTRGFVRRRLCRKDWWGCPTVFLQDENTCKELWDEMLQYPERGLKPVAYLDICEEDLQAEQKILNIQKNYVRPIFVWCGSNSAETDNSLFFEKITRLCQNVLYMPCEKIKIKKFSLVPRIIGTSMGFVVRQNLTDVRRLRVKRFIDLLFASVGFVCVLPLGVLIALSIRLTTGSSAIYVQNRLGRGGENVKIYKFRTMAPNAEILLKKYLEDNPEFREEWEKNHKLYNDPRITCVGRFLRKTSLDELPQLINVLIGNMSLVGPRPIVADEIERYGEVYLNYSAVKPGVTGLWQISGRNLTTYEQRVWYDNYYVTNWSLWMDLWILARTIPVVIRGYGAY